MQCKTSIFIERLSYTLQDTFFMSRPCIGSPSFMTVYVFCPRAKSAPVERRFSHCGLFVRWHQARIGHTFQFQLTLAKCNRCSLLHCLTVICLDTRVLANVPVSGKNVLPPTLLVGYFCSAIDARTVPDKKKQLRSSCLLLPKARHRPLIYDKDQRGARPSKLENRSRRCGCNTASSVV